jgi:hypothetical protein
VEEEGGGVGEEVGFWVWSLDPFCALWFGTGFFYI